MTFCFYIGRRLSAYCDGEMSLNERARIEEHLESCASCRARYAHICKRIRLLQQLPRLDPADELWDSIERDLPLSTRPGSAGTVSPGGQLDFGKRRLLQPAAIAGALAVIVTALLLASYYRLLPGRHKGELNLAGYLDQVGTIASADAVRREFPAAPGFTEVKWPDARAAVDFPVIGPESLPGGYSLTAVRLYTRGKLRALQLKYRSEQGSLCAFQMPARSKLSFGGWPSERCTVGGLPCRRTSTQGCSAYGFTLGETRCVLLMRRADPAVVGELIQAFRTEHEKAQQQRN